MATHLRYIVKMNGDYYKGTLARRLLSNAVGKACKTKDELIAAAKLLEIPLYIFREPKRLKRERSRYCKFCYEYGLPGPKVAKKVGAARQPYAGGLGGLNGAINQQFGFAAARAGGGGPDFCAIMAKNIQNYLG